MQYRGRNLLIPVKADIAEAADLDFETLPAERVLAGMRDARNRTNIIVLDSCRNSPFRSLFSLSGNRAVTRGMARMDAPTGSYVAYSTAPGDVAYDGSGRYSPFAEAFADEIKTPGVSIGDMMVNVRVRVRDGHRPPRNAANAMGLKLADGAVRVQPGRARHDAAPHAHTGRDRHNASRGYARRCGGLGGGGQRLRREDLSA